jgi:hypothetical protein
LICFPMTLSAARWSLARSRSAVAQAEGQSDRQS